jgi:hypothetical protein
VGLTDGDGLGLADGVAVEDASGGGGGAAPAVPEGMRKASGTRAEAATASRARRLGADVGTERY